MRLRGRELTWRDVEGEIVALDLATSVYFSSSGSGAVLWHLLARGATREQLAEALVGRFGIDPARARGDVDAFLAELDEHGLVER